MYFIIFIKVCGKDDVTEKYSYVVFLGNKQMYNNQINSRRNRRYDMCFKQVLNNFI